MLRAPPGGVRTVRQTTPLTAGGKPKKQHNNNHGTPGHNTAKAIGRNIYNAIDNH